MYIVSMMLILAASGILDKVEGSATKNATLQLIMSQAFFDNVHTNLAVPLIKQLPNVSLGEFSLDFDLGFMKLASNLTKLSFDATSYD